MIKNIIFDMGNVLLSFEGDSLMRRYVPDADDCKLLMKELFETGDWVKLDWGQLREEGLADLVCPRVPARLREPLRQMLTHWYQHLEMIPGSYELVAELKTAGYKVYLLSNAGYSLEEVYRHDVPAIGLMDGRIISALEGVIKPHDEIYKRLFDRFDLQPEECFFIDDLPANIEGSKRNGMDGHVFDGDHKALRQALISAGVALK